MKFPSLLALGITVLISQTAAVAQPQPLPGPGVPLPPPGSEDFQSRLRGIITRANPPEGPAPTRFSLNFPGGNPKQLAAAIEQAMGKTLNVIVPDEFADTKLPPIKVSDVTVPQLFQTLLEGSPGFGRLPGSYGFKAIEGPRTDESIWTFFVVKNQAPGLLKFSIDFPGGTPKELVSAIQKATGKPLNAIIPDDLAKTQLPPLKMSNVDASELFKALLMASQKREAYATGNSGSYQIGSYAWGFRSDGSPSDDSIWYFFAEKPMSPPQAVPVKVCRFYSLANFLERGVSVDDITTAIQTGWKMLGDKETPAISFHKETKLLIAVGEPGKLETIDAVLRALSSAPPALSGSSLNDRLQSIIQPAGAGVALPQPTSVPQPGPLPKPPERVPPRTLRQPESSSTNN